ncbi:MAG: flagellar hook-basal body protein [Bacillota bacterium]|jgi:flagellar basal-body rod protein FlgG
MSEVLRGLYASATGMTARILQQDLIANNLANVSTNGYKRSGALNTQFDEVLLMNLSQRDPRSSRVGPLSRGVRTYESYVDFSHGTVTETGDPLDLALDGDGFFVVLQDGELRYTRNGSFVLGAGGYIMTDSGGYLMGTRGPLRVGSGTLLVTEDGKVYSRRSGVQRGDAPVVEDEYIDDLWLADFEDRTALRRVGDSLFEYVGTQRVDLIGQIGQTVTVKQGMIEGSNVNVVKEMVDMIECFRAYESAQKMVLIQDETLDKLVNQVNRVG